MQSTYPEGRGLCHHPDLLSCLDDCRALKLHAPHQDLIAQRAQHLNDRWRVSVGPISPKVLTVPQRSHRRQARANMLTSHHLTVAGRMDRLAPLATPIGIVIVAFIIAIIW